PGRSAASRGRPAPRDRRRRRPARRARRWCPRREPGRALRRPLDASPAVLLQWVPRGKARRGESQGMLVKMRRDATDDEISTVESKLHDLGFKTGKMVGEEITLIGVYGDITTLRTGEIAELAGVEQLIPISRAYKRVAQKGTPESPLYQNVRI